MPATGSITNQVVMAAYADANDLAEYANLSGTGPSDTVAVEAGVQSGIDMAEAFANWLARNAGHTTVPIPSTSKDFPYLQTLVTKLAIAETYFKRGRRDNVDEQSPQFGTYGVMSGMYKQARKDLEAFFAGVVDGSGGPEVVQPGQLEQVDINFGNRCW